MLMNQPIFNRFLFTRLQECAFVTREIFLWVPFTMSVSGAWIELHSSLAGKASHQIERPTSVLAGDINL
jgi:hypothetical protein